MFELQDELMKTTGSETKRKIGALAGEKFLSDGYDFDEANGEIAEMFGVNEM